MSRTPLLPLLASLLAAAFPLLSSHAAEPLPAAAIQDNSFLVEEAYNQEAGVVQHILNIGYGVDQLRGSDDRELLLNFTQEWPVFSQTHQFSYTLPYSFTESGGAGQNGINDIVLSYRFQASLENERSLAFAPRISLIVPTGDSDKGFGNDSLGYQINLPVSKMVGRRWSVHANAGATWFPDVHGHDLVNYNIAASGIYALRSNFHLMLECVGIWEQSVNDSGRRGRSFSAVLSPGFRYAWNHANDAQTVLGLAAPIGLTAEAPDYGVIFYLSHEHFFHRGTASPAVK